MSKFKQGEIFVGYNEYWDYFYIQDRYTNQFGVEQVLLTHIDKCDSIKTIAQAKKHYMEHFLEKHNKIKENDKEKPDE